MGSFKGAVSCCQKLRVQLKKNSFDLVVVEFWGWWLSRIMARKELRCEKKVSRVI
jgi:hypothetical protein